MTAGTPFRAEATEGAQRAYLSLSSQNPPPMPPNKGTWHSYLHPSPKGFEKYANRVTLMNFPKHSAVFDIWLYLYTRIVSQALLYDCQYFL